MYRFRHRANWPTRRERTGGTSAISARSRSAPPRSNSRPLIARSRRAISCGPARRSRPSPMSTRRACASSPPGARPMVCGSNATSNARRWCAPTPCPARPSNSRATRSRRWRGCARVSSRTCKKFPARASSTASSCRCSRPSARRKRIRRAPHGCAASSRKRKRRAWSRASSPSTRCRACPSRPKPEENIVDQPRPPLPPFTAETAAQKARGAEDAWNSRDPARVALAYTIDSRWRNRAEIFSGRDAIVAFLTRKWAKELDYRLIKEVWAFGLNRIAVRFAYEWYDDGGHWFRSYGNENWEFDEHGLMRVRHASINDLPIAESERKFRWPLGRRPDDHPGLTALGL